jgi:hypothetical protein
MATARSKVPHGAFFCWLIDDCVVAHLGKWIYAPKLIVA